MDEENRAEAGERLRYRPLTALAVVLR